MADERLTSIAGILLERSKGGEVPWKETADEYTFSASYRTYSVSISQRVHYLILSDGTPTQQVYVLTVYNERGTEVDSLEATPENYDQLKELFETAKHKGIRKDEVLNDLLERLTAEERPI